MGKSRVVGLIRNKIRPQRIAQALLDKLSAGGSEGAIQFRKDNVFGGFWSYSSNVLDAEGESVKGLHSEVNILDSGTNAVLDVSQANHFQFQPINDYSISFSNAPIGKSIVVTLELIEAGGYVGIFNSVAWGDIIDGNNSISSSGRTILTFLWNGENWYGGIFGWGYV